MSITVIVSAIAIFGVFASIITYLHSMKITGENTAKTVGVITEKMEATNKVILNHEVRTRVTEYLVDEMRRSNVYKANPFSPPPETSKALRRGAMAKVEEGLPSSIYFSSSLGESE